MIESLIIALIQGITEFIPVSSSLHIILVSDIMNFKKFLLTSVSVHLGSLIALILFMFKNKDLNLILKDYKLIVRLLVFCVSPLFIIGFLMFSFFSQNLGISYFTIFFTLFFGIFLIIIDNLESKKNDIKNLSIKDLLIIGLFQCLSLIPGTSRSASIIIVSRFVGLNNESSIKLSLILSFPVILGAFSLTFFNYFESISFNISSVILDIIFSFIISYFAIKIFYKFSSARGFRFFGVYRIILSIFLLIYYF